MMLQEPMPLSHPLAGTVAHFVWLLLGLPLLGFGLNGALAMMAAAKLGPADPSAAGGHGEHAGDHHHDGAGGGAQDTDARIAHDDHPAVRHKYAGLVSLSGPAVLVITFALAIALFAALRSFEMARPYVDNLFRWMPVSALKFDVALQLDPLSMVMVLVITGVSALIHIFSVGYMQHD